MNANDWEQRYATGDTPWEKGAPSPGLVDFLATHPLDGKIAVPGCGYGHDVRAIARPGNEVIGLDIAPRAVERAKAFPKVADEIYRVADWFDLAADLRGCFDWVWEHTCFCAIDPSLRPAYVEAAGAALKSHGHLLAIFYLDPGGEADGQPPFGVTTAELDGLFRPSFELIKEWKPARAYEGREGRELMRLLRKRA